MKLLAVFQNEGHGHSSGSFRTTQPSCKVGKLRHQFEGVPVFAKKAKNEGFHLVNEDPANRCLHSS